MTMFFDLYCVPLPMKTITLQYISIKMKMKNIISTAIFVLAMLPMNALANNEYYSENIHPTTPVKQDSLDISPFRGEIYNKEYEVSIRFDFYKNNILVPGQDIFGELSGYIKSRRDSRFWLITSAEIDRKLGVVTMEIINDYGSEDLVATLTYDKETKTFTLHQKQGSTIKFAKNGKWQKLPSTLVFTKR